MTNSSDSPREPWVRIGSGLGALFIHARGGRDDEAKVLHPDPRYAVEIVLPKDPCVTQVWKDGRCACDRFTLLVW